MANEEKRVHEKILMSVSETKAYLGLGDTMTRKLMREEDFGLRIGGRLYSNKILLDKWLDKKCRSAK